MDIKDQFDRTVVEKYEIYDYNKAGLILKYYYQEQYDDVIESLKKYRILIKDILEPGGSESQIPKKFKKLIVSRGWTDEVVLHSKSIVEQRKNKKILNKVTIEHDTHRVDYVKGKVAIDFEWNSKDQTYDRDLYAFRAFHDSQMISVAIIITRGYDIEKWIGEYGNFIPKDGKPRPLKSKFGASTTNMTQLTRRLEANRQGGCPTLVFGITSKIIDE